MKKIYILLILGLMLGTLFSDIYDTEEIIPLRTRWINTGWIMYGILAVLICIGMAAIVYIIGYVIDANNLKRWAMAEGLNSVASAIMIILLVLLVQLTFSYITDELLEGGVLSCKGAEMNATEPINFAKCRLEEQIIVLDDLYNQIYLTNAVWEKHASKCYSALGFTVWCGDWFGNTRKQIESGYLLTNKIIPLTIALHTVWVILDYIAATMLILFLPLGILLRAFPISRGIGGLLIAIAIGTYFIFPVLYVMLDPSFTVRPAGAEPPFLEHAYGCFPGFRGGVALANIINTEEVYTYTTFSYQRIGDILVEITIRAIYYPFVAFAATVGMILSLAPILGGDGGDMLRLISKSV